MKIAILSPITWRTPPRNYGPWEQVASSITEGLSDLGHDVTLYATRDSVTRGTLESVCPIPLGEAVESDAKVWECLHISELMEGAGSYDIIHNHFDFLPLTYSRLIPTPMITTIHGFSSSHILPVYKKYDATTTYISISNANRHSELTYLSTIYHGIQPESFPYQARKDDYLLYFGRIHPDKGTHLAIQIARKAGHPLTVAGLIQDQGYFAEKIKPAIDSGEISYVGNADQEERTILLGRAKALVHPVCFEEPFGLSIIEAMMCGTPVIAFNRGSMPELIDDGHTGFLVNNVEEAACAVLELDLIDPRNCRNRAMALFSRNKMVSGYVEAYRKILTG